MSGGAPQVQRGSQLADSHLAPVIGENFQNAREPVNDLNGRTASDGGISGVIPS
jgi:hypothetical protein